jgi:hypothetical protein
MLSSARVILQGRLVTCPIPWAAYPPARLEP